MPVQLGEKVCGLARSRRNEKAIRRDADQAVEKTGS